MSDAEENQISQALAQARRGLSPGSGDLERVRRALDVALRAPAAPVARAAPAAGPWRRWMGRIALAGALTGAGATVGYWAGRRAERHQIAPVRPAAPASPLVARTPAPPLEIERPVPEPAAADVHRTERHRHPAVPFAPAQTPGESLAVEVRALRNVERALRDHNPGLASAFLDDLDQQVPGGQLREERAALRTIARCAAGTQPFGVDLADEFTQAFPASAYRARVEQACPRTDSRNDGDSAGRR